MSGPDLKMHSIRTFFNSHHSMSHHTVQKASEFQSLRYASKMCTSPKHFAVTKTRLSIRDSLMNTSHRVSIQTGRYREVAANGLLNLFKRFPAWHPPVLLVASGRKMKIFFLLPAINHNLWFITNIHNFHNHTTRKRQAGKASRPSVFWWTFFSSKKCAGLTGCRRFTISEAVRS